MPSASFDADQNGLTPAALASMRLYMHWWALFTPLTEPKKAQRLSRSAESAFKELNEGFEIYLKRLCEALMPGFQAPRGDKVQGFLDALDGHLSFPLLDAETRRLLRPQRQARNALAHEGSTLSQPVRPEEQQRADEVFDRLPAQQQHVVRTAAMLMSATFEIDQAVRRVHPALVAPASSLDEGEVEEIEDTFEALALSADELIRYPQTLRINRRALPDDWTLPLPIGMEAVLVAFALWLQQNLAPGEVVTGGQGTAVQYALSLEKGVQFTLSDDRDALADTAFTMEDGWGVVWFPDGRAAFWPLTDLPERVSRHFFGIQVTFPGSDEQVTDT
ncbi:hypothetical protein [Deinococcus multiflagellatus]|uniref:Uncharacterized protein n=1 Tax=Deinococcus multiflagellatus TaxID=1656887 RepID=A0ABW1ZP25_9DEIO|nr:hypothetical protein [Deinococcus multiflagellatus]MBZ9715818.1 hypothetical protein [Deinococcus multiflagellatus]